MDWQNKWRRYLEEKWQRWPRRKAAAAITTPNQERISPVDQLQAQRRNEGRSSLTVTGRRPLKDGVRWGREVVVPRLQGARNTVAEKALVLKRNTAAWLQTALEAGKAGLCVWLQQPLRRHLVQAWQATFKELQRTWRYLTPVSLPGGWQARALSAVLVLTILIPGVTYFFRQQAPPSPPPSSPPAPAAKPLPAVPVRADETNLLARLVAAEAENEPYPGQVAVVAVVLNRLRDPNFPKTIADIIFEPWAFESVANGHYWNVPVLPRYYAATSDALNDWDPSNGALYFFNPATATSAWIWSRPQITRIGSHIFMR